MFGQIGFGERAIDEVPGGSNIAVPAVSIGVATAAVNSTAGAQVTPMAPSAVVVFTPLPRAAGGSRVAAPSVSIAAAAPTPRAASGVKIRAYWLAPGYGGNGSIGELALGEDPLWPLTVTVRAWSPRVAISAKVAPGVSAVAVGVPVPKISSGGIVHVPAVNVAVAALSRQPFGTTTIIVANTLNQEFYGGGIGESSIGEFAIGEGPYFTRSVLVAPRVLVDTPIPFIRTGARINVPAVNVAVAAGAGEISARDRRVRVQLLAT